MTTATTLQRHSAQPDSRVHERIYSPRADLYANDEALLLQVDLPGVSADGLSVELHGNQLTLEGRRSESLRYRRVLKLPNGLDPDGISAELRDGVLTVTLPRSEAHKPRRIEVQSR